MREHWTLDPDVVFLGHGSFGACPTPVLKAQQELRAQMEREPVRFFMRELAPLLAEARIVAAEFVGAQPDDFVFVRNATEAVNAVLRSLSLSPGDELLTTNHAYGACNNALTFVAERAGAHVTTAAIPFPLSSPAAAVSAVLAAVTDKTKLALLDHVTSPTGLVLPLKEIIAALTARGVEVLVDGAHAPGMLELNVSELGATYYAGNFHKWVCAPKGAAFLWVRTDRQQDVRPLTIGHGMTSGRGRSRFLEEFDWPGTDDASSWLCVPAAIRFMEGLVDGGWPEIRRKNNALVLEGRSILCEALDVPVPAPDSMIGSLAAVPLPVPGPPAAWALGMSPLEERILDEHGIQARIVAWPRAPARLVRLAAQLYNQPDDFHRLARALVAEIS